MACASLGACVALCVVTVFVWLVCCWVLVWHVVSLQCLCGMCVCTVLPSPGHSPRLFLIVFLFAFVKHLQRGMICVCTLHVQNPPPSWKCLDFVSSGSSLPYLFQCSTIKHVKRVCCDAHSKHYINFQMEKICWLICSNMGRSC